MAIYVIDSDDICINCGNPIELDRILDGKDTCDYCESVIKGDCEEGYESPEDEGDLQ